MSIGAIARQALNYGRRALNVAPEFLLGDSSEVIGKAMKENTGVYFGATGGAGALLANHVVSAQVIAYEDLGAEAIRELVVKDFPAIVIIDSKGNNLYQTEPLKYKID